jgi:hypothetical protein
VVNSTMPDSALLSSAGLTISVVCQLDTSGLRELVAKQNASGTTNFPIDFRINSTTIEAIRANASDFKYYSGPAATTGAYRMYSVVYADQNVNTTPVFYVGTTATNGTAAGGAATGAATGSSGNLRIGRRFDGAVQMDGVIAYALIYNRAQSAAEIAQNYNVLKTRLAARGITLP